MAIHVDMEALDLHPIPIAGFDKYAITPNGQVVNIITSKLLTPGKQSNGYLYNGLTDNDGKLRHFRQHRLVCLTFKPIDNPDEYQVNHINGDKHDNRLENLEWVTPLGNMEHAWTTGLITLTPISVRDIDTGQVDYYPSMQAYANISGLHKAAVRYRCTIGECRIFPERKQYRIGHDDTPWYVTNDPDLVISYTGAPTPVLLRNIHTGEELEFPTQGDLAHYFHCKPETIGVWLSNPNQPIIRSSFQIKRANSVASWRTIDNPFTDPYQVSPSRPMVVVDDATKKTWVYPSRLSCIKARALSCPTLRYRLKSRGTVVFTDGCRYGYQDEWAGDTILPERVNEHVELT